MKLNQKELATTIIQIVEIMEESKEDMTLPKDPYEWFYAILFVFILIYLFGLLGIKIVEAEAVTIILVTLFIAGSIIGAGLSEGNYKETFYFALAFTLIPTILTVIGIPLIHLLH